MDPRDSDVSPEEMFLLSWPHSQNLGVYPPACVMLKLRQLFFDFPKAPPFIHSGSRDQLRPFKGCKSQAEEVPPDHTATGASAFWKFCCRITHGQVRTWPWLSCWGTAKGHPEQEQSSSTFPSQSQPEWATRQLLWTERWRDQAGSDERNSGDWWFIA